MKILRLFIPLLIFALACACGNQSNMTGQLAKTDFDERYKEGLPPDLDSIFKHADLSPQEKDALIFLYAYMPLADMMNYDANFHLENVRSTLKAAEEMPWGQNIPMREFRHFVLPLRVNNENLDMSRPKFYRELKDRIKGMSMEEAILEINHWCHEKVTYQPTDSRTNSPLATISATEGRCGEESTFLVAALRSVGIPARQIYTPRWAHTDDNHAWVEAWANGKWHFLGACEPRAVLDLGWFNEAASRSLILTTNVYGRYDGSEEVVTSTPLVTTINVTSNYAATAPIRVEVTDAEGNPVEGADVSFCIYNYAEFYPVATKKTNSEGKASIKAGIGDMIVWAGKDDMFQFALANSYSPCRIRLMPNAYPLKPVSLDIIPPSSYATYPMVSKEAEEKNSRRMAIEDSIRMAYEATFYSHAKAVDLAVEIDSYPSKLIEIMSNSKGHWPVIEAFLIKNKEEGDKAVTLLENISKKDLNDITPLSLDDHMATPNLDTDLFGPYVLNPRVSNEMIVPYKRMLSDSLASVASTPAQLISWVSDNIAIDSVWSTPRIPVTPAGVWKAKRADKHSRDIFFVACARSLGIPSRIHPVTGTVQYSDGGKWINVNFETAKPAQSAKGYMKFDPQDDDFDAKYYTHFTICKIDNGKPHLLAYDDSCNAEYFTSPRSLEAGQYLLVTGQRLTNGDVMALASFFTIKPGLTTTVPFAVRNDFNDISVLGSFDCKNTIHLLESGEMAQIMSKVGRGYYVLGYIDPRMEASVHALNDLCAVAAELYKTEEPIILLMPEDAAASFNPSDYPSLPTATLGYDPDGYLLSTEFTGNLSPETNSLPIFIIADTFNRVVWMSHGYNIGLGQQILDKLHMLKEN